MRGIRDCVVVSAALIACAAPLLSATEEPTRSTFADTFARQADAMDGLVRTNTARTFLDAIPELPGVGEGRAIMYDSDTGDALSRAVYNAMDENDPDRERFEVLPVDDTLYYTRLFGTPALYTRALDIASTHGLATLDETRVFDFGFGQIGHLRAMASVGAHCVGVEVNPLLEALYSEPSDTGIIERHADAPEGPPGTLRVVYGAWPGHAETADAVGGRFDLIISKNVLKRGYIHPDREADPSRLIDLGVDDNVFLSAMYDALVPGGLAVIYNFSPKQAEADEPFIPWADGRCPFEEDELLEAGFEVLAYNVDDTAHAIDHFVAVEAGTRENLDGDLFGMYTVMRKPM